MKKYSKIIVGVELLENNDRLIVEKAALLKNEGAELILVHAIEHLSSYGAAYEVAVGADIEQMMIDNAKKNMLALGNKLGVKEDYQNVHIGPASVVILEEAEKLKADLIVVGSHGRRGIRLLLGSTANATLHGAKCDVLAVRLPA